MCAVFLIHKSGIQLGAHKDLYMLVCFFFGLPIFVGLKGRHKGKPPFGGVLRKRDTPIWPVDTWLKDGSEARALSTCVPRITSYELHEQLTHVVTQTKT